MLIFQNFNSSNILKDYKPDIDNIEIVVKNRNAESWGGEIEESRPEELKKTVDSKLDCNKHTEKNFATSSDDSLSRAKIQTKNSNEAKNESILAGNKNDSGSKFSTQNNRKVQLNVPKNNSSGENTPNETMKPGEEQKHETSGNMINAPDVIELQDFRPKKKPTLRKSKTKSFVSGVKKMKNISDYDKFIYPCCCIEPAHR